MMKQGYSVLDVDRIEGRARISNDQSDAGRRCYRSPVLVSVSLTAGCRWIDWMYLVTETTHASSDGLLRNFETREQAPSQFEPNSR